jgi:hypothetical protein
LSSGKKKKDGKIYPGEMSNEPCEAGEERMEQG